MGLRGPIGIDAKAAMARRATEGEPSIPSGLSEADMCEWERVTGLLRERGMLDALDQAALHDYLACWRRLQEAEADVEARGLLVEGERGMVKNPSCQLAREYRGMLLAWSKELGLTPVSRLRMPEKPKPSSGSKYAEFKTKAGECR